MTNYEAESTTPVYAENWPARVPKAQQSRLAARSCARPSLRPTRRKPAPPGAASPDIARAGHHKLAEAMDEAENDVLAYMDFPAAHRPKLHSTNGLEWLNKEVKRRADVVAIFPNEASIIRLVSAVLMEANDEWRLQHRICRSRHSLSSRRKDDRRLVER